MAVEKNLILLEPSLREERIIIFSNINLFDLGDSALKIMILNVGQMQNQHSILRINTWFRL